MRLVNSHRTSFSSLQKRGRTAHMFSPILSSKSNVAKIIHSGDSKRLHFVRGSPSQLCHTRHISTHTPNASLVPPTSLMRPMSKNNLRSRSSVPATNSSFIQTRALVSAPRVSLPSAKELPPLPTQTQELLEALLAGNRTALARSITLVESTRRDHRVQAGLLLSHLLQHPTYLERDARSFRIGIAGPPGAGKSTFIDALGNYILQLADDSVLCPKELNNNFHDEIPSTNTSPNLTNNVFSNSGKRETNPPTHRLAVLAVDPSSTRTGGSILGDLTRMSALTPHPRAFIRPSPTRGALGGLTRSSGDAQALCVAAGYSTVLVETVGVGQSEIVVEDVVDMVVLLAQPAGGDELQGIKKGIMEVVDMVVVNKADGELLAAAKRSVGQVMAALHFLRPKTEVWVPRVGYCSAATGDRIDQVWDVMQRFWQTMNENDYLTRRRGEQHQRKMWTIIKDELLQRFLEDPSVSAALTSFEDQVISSKITPGRAADQLLDLFLTNKR